MPWLSKILLLVVGSELSSVTLTNDAARNVAILQVRRLRATNARRGLLPLREG